MSDVSQINELKQKRAEKIEKAREILDKEDGDSLSAERQEQYDNVWSDVSDLGERIEREEQLLAAERDLETRGERIKAGEDPNVPEDHRDMPVEEIEELESRAFEKYLRRQEDQLTATERQFLYHARSRFPDDFAGYDELREQRAGQQQTGAGAGGEFIPEGFRREIVVAQKAFGGLENRAEVIDTNTGNDLPWPVSDDTGNTGSLVGEASTISATTSVPTGSVTLEAAKYQSGPVKASIEIEQDSAFDINSWLRSRLGERLGRVFAQHIVTRSSTESSGPHGIINASTGATSITQGTTTLTPGALRDLIHTVDPAYRQRGTNSVAFLMNDGSLKNFAKLEDGDGRPLWQPSLQQGVPDRILGFPLQIDQNMPSMSSTEPNDTKPVIFGDLSHYKVRRVMSMVLFRLTERFIEQGNIGYIAFQRADGRAVLGSTTPAQKPFRALLATT